MARHSDFRSLIVKKKFTLTDVFRPVGRVAPVRLFLCGSGLKDDAPRFQDYRNQVKAALPWRWNVHVTLGEDVPFDVSREHFDCLSQEMKEAKECDLTIIFLGSPGTLVELGAFASDDQISIKTNVIIDAKFQTDKSFINVGPLAKIPSMNKRFLPFYPSMMNMDLVECLDEMIAPHWFHRRHYPTVEPETELITKDKSLLLMLLIAIYPIGKTEFKKQCQRLIPEARLNTALALLIESGYVTEYHRLLMPAPGRISEILRQGQRGSAERARLRFLGSGLREAEFATRVRGIM